jgi:hypoxanthine phosphoribosyltransferase
MITEEQISQKVKELGKAISFDYRDKNLLLIAILKGSVVFLADLIRSISLPLHIDFMAVSSYGTSTATSGVVRILKDLEAEIEGKDVLIVEDIVDTGLTLCYLKENLYSRGPASLKVCTFLDKPSRRKVTIVPDYNGYEIPDEFVVGYGLDCNEEFRNLPYIAVVKTDEDN